MKIVFKRWIAAAATAAGAQTWLWAQTNAVATNLLVNTNMPVRDIGTPPALVPLPSSPSDFWVLGIGLVTPIIVSGVRRWVPAIPTVCLPLITPVIGLLIGLGLHYAGQDFSWWDGAKAGALAVFFRETVDQAIKARQATAPSPTPPAA